MGVCSTGRTASTGMAHAPSAGTAHNDRRIELPSAKSSDFVKFGDVAWWDEGDAVSRVRGGQTS